MSIDRDIEFLRADRAALELQIQRCGPNEDLVRLGLQGRLTEITAELARVEQNAVRTARATLLFRGSPIHGTRGIEAEFAGQTLDAYQRLVAKAAAARSGKPLGSRGPVPGGEKARLFVTGTAAGSFGFTLEHEPVELFAVDTLGPALDDVGQLLEATKDDELFAESVETTDPEVLAALSKFLGILADNGATVRCVSGKVDAGIDDSETVQVAYRRTATVSDSKDSPELGTLLGVLPNGRKFELRVHGTDELISGRISRDIEDPAVLKTLLDQECIAHLRVISFERPGGRQFRRYELLGIDRRPKN